MDIYGRHPVLFRLKSGKQVEAIFLQENFDDPQLLEAIKQRGLPITYRSRPILDKMVGLNHQGIVARIADFSYYPFLNLLKQNPQVILICDGISDPQNLGAIIRVADALSLDAIIIRKDRSCPVNATVYKVSTGAVDAVKIVQVTNLVRTISTLKEHGFWIVGLDAAGADYRQFDYTGKIAIVVGDEGLGLSRLVIKNCDYLAALPQRGTVNSLNAAMAAAVMLYHVDSIRNPG